MNLVDSESEEYKTDCISKWMLHHNNTSKSLYSVQWYTIFDINIFEDIGDFYVNNGISENIKFFNFLQEYEILR